MASILIVDPEPRISEVIRKVLASGGHAVRTASTQAEAEAALQEEAAEIIVADSDFATDLLGDGKGKGDQPLVLVTCLLPDKPIVLDALRRGAFRFVTKPVSVKDMQTAVADAVQELEDRQKA